LPPGWRPMRSMRGERWGWGSEGLSTRDGLVGAKAINGLAVGVRVVSGMMRRPSGSAWRYLLVVGS
jgi:hypothetical protein